MVSALGMGTLYLTKNQEYLFSRSFEQGINHFDTADSYNEGASDYVLRMFLKGKPREKILISSKVYYPTNYGGTSFGLNREHILKSVDQSLKRLDTDYLDILYLHRYDNNVPFEETIEALDVLINQGKIKYWGTSAFSTFQLCEAYYKAHCVGFVAPIAMQHAYNLFNRTIELELKDALDRLNVSIVGYYGLAQGVLTGKYVNLETLDDTRAACSEARKKMWDFTSEKIDKSRKFALFCNSRNLSPSAVALGWCLQNSNIASVLTHVNSISQLLNNLESIDIIFTPEDMALLENIFNNKPINLYTKVRY